MLRNKLTILICFTSVCSFAQSRFFFNTGIGTYAMSDLKEVQLESEESAPVKMKTIKLFPAYFNYEGGFDIRIGKMFFVGGSAGYGSTGSRSDYNDYSGSLRIDQLWKYTSVGLSGGVIQKLFNDKVLLRYELRSGFLFNEGNLSSKEVVGQQQYTENIDVHAWNVYVQPMATITRRFGPFGLDAYLGFNINAYHGEITEVGDDSGAYYGFSNGTRIAVDWTGLRAGVGLSLFLGKK